MPGRREIIWAERYQVSSLCVAGVMCYQGRQPYMEDRFSVVTNINGAEVSLYAVFDGHAGEFAADFACEVIIPSITDKITEILDLIQLKIQKSVKKPDEVKNDPTSDENDETTEPEVDTIEENPLNDYISSENIINYEKLLHDEILYFDSILLQRMAKAALFCGTTANIVIVDLTNKLIICANVGDSRAVMCDAKGNAFPLSQDHKPNNPEELLRIRENGGHISNKSGCWRVDGTLACSRSIGDYPLKHKKYIIADPDIMTYKFKDFK